MGANVSFQKLTGNIRSRILLANLYDTAQANLVRADIQKTALKGLHATLSALGPRPRHKTVLYAIGRFLHADGADYKILAAERPDERDRFALVVSFAKVKPILNQMARRIKQTHPSDAATIQVALRARATLPALTDAVAVLNRHREGSTELTISNVNLLIWGAPLDALDAVLADPVLAADERANRMRDMLGLIQLTPAPTDPERYMFVFRSDQSLKDIRAKPSHFSVARPTTFDGFDNHRFCQRDLGGRKIGWGNTVDLAAGTCGTGLPEVVLTPLSIANFTCEYLGEIRSSRFASDRRYFSMMAPSPPDSALMAAELDTLAMTP